MKEIQPKHKITYIHVIIVAEATKNCPAFHKTYNNHKKKRDFTKMCRSKKLIIGYKILYSITHKENTNMYEILEIIIYGVIFYMLCDWLFFNQSETAIGTSGVFPRGHIF